MIEAIHNPDELKQMPLGALPALAGEIRQLIVEAVDNHGGHLASNLGVVELTIALHRVFDSPFDWIIFDTSHQCYTHKLLTGRYPDFVGLRTAGGISGFYEPAESIHDPIVIGHAGTGPSMSVGFGIAEGLRNSERYTICVVGDGALTSGLSYEGLSNMIGCKPRNMIVILNDNGMSISPNVGWIARWRNRWLSQVRNDVQLDEDFDTFERAGESLAKKVPLGNALFQLAKGVKSTVDKAIIPNMGMYWEDMGFKYVGPVDGHDIPALIEVLTSAKNQDRIPFIHVVTRKGKGHNGSEKDPVTFHQPGSPNAAVPTYSKVFCDALGELMETDDRIVAISAAMLTGTGLNELQERFPDRVFDVGIAEGHAVSMAAAMAAADLRPVVCIYSTFLQRAFDQIIHDVGVNDLPVIFGVDRAGLVGQDGKTHHGLYDIGYMRMCPNMVVSIPKDENEMRRLLYTAMQQSHPFAIRYPRGQGVGAYLGPMTEIDIGSMDLLRPGTDICLAAAGPMVNESLAAAEYLEGIGISARVVNMRFAKPIPIMDMEERLQGIENIYVIEDAVSVGGLRSAILECMSDYGMRKRVVGISAGNDLIEHAGVGELKQSLGLTCEGICRVVSEIEGGLR